MVTAEKADPAAASALTTLPVGLFVGEARHATYALAPITGRDRKLIAEPDVRVNGGKIMTTLLTNCVRSIGDIDLGDKKAAKTWLRQMLTADRTFLLLQMRRQALGPKIELQADCPKCSGANTFELHIDELEVRPLPTGARVVHDELTGFSVEIDLKLPDHDIDAVMRYPNGSDEEAVAPLMRANPVEANLAALTRCLRRLGAETVVTREMVEAMSLPRLDALAERWESLQPGVSLEYGMSCWSCRTRVPLEVNALDFLFPSSRKTR